MTGNYYLVAIVVGSAALGGCKSDRKRDGDRARAGEAQTEIWADHQPDPTSTNDPELARVLGKAVETGVYYVVADGCDLYASPDPASHAAGKVPSGKKFAAKLAYCSDAERCKRDGMLTTVLCGDRTDCWYGDAIKPPIQWIRTDCVQGERPFIDD